jgi:hypothetical protein
VVDDEVDSVFVALIFPTDGMASVGEEINGLKPVERETRLTTAAGAAWLAAGSFGHVEKVPDTSLLLVEA